MQNSDIARALNLEFFQSELGLALLLIAALLVLVSVLLTVLVVSSSAAQRTLIARLESANKLLVHIHENLARGDNQQPPRRWPMPSQPASSPTSRPEPAPRSAAPAEASAPPVRSAGPEQTERRSAGSTRKRPPRNAPTDGRTDVYVSTDAAGQDALPSRGRRGAQPKRSGRAGDSTDIFTSVDI